MRINVEKYRSIADTKQITDEQVRRNTGLSEKTFTWIMENRFIEVGTLETIADAIGCSLQDIAAEDSTSNNENAIEWLKDAKTALVTLTQGRYITKIKKYTQSNPKECKVLTENADGSICARIPISWVKISPPREVSEEQRKISRNNMNKLHLKRVSSTRVDG